MDTDDILKPRGAWSFNSLAELWDTSPSTVQEYVAAGLLEAVRFGRSPRVLEAERLRFEASAPKIQYHRVLRSERFARSKAKRKAAEGVSATM